MAGPAGRDPAIDATRGLALLGILIANISFFAMPGGVAGTWWREVYSGWTDIAATFVVRTLFENTFILVFSFLFGWGAARQLAVRPSSRFRWRLVGLAAAGVLHALLLWPGDILLAYALLALMLPAATRWPLAKLCRVGLLLCAVAIVGNAAVGVLLVTMDPQPIAAEAVIALYRSGNFTGILKMRLSEWAEFYGFGMLVLFPIIGAAFFGGVAAQRLPGDQPSSAIIPFLMRRAHFVFWPAMLGNLAYGLLATAPKSVADGALIAPEIILRALFSPLLALLILAGSLRFFTSRFGETVLKPFQANGRMSLSVYVTQSIVCVLIFHGYGAGLYATIGPAGSIVAALCIFAGMTLLAQAWLRGFSQGPLEMALAAVTGAFSSKVDAGLRPENATRQETSAALRFNPSEKGSRSREDSGGWRPSEALEGRGKP
jgi:uncharacterized protein